MGSKAETQRVSGVKLAIHVERVWVWVREDVGVAIARLAGCYDAGASLDFL